MNETFRRLHPPCLPDYVTDDAHLHQYRAPMVPFQHSGHQKIDLPKPLLFYILNTSKHQILEKLYATSKQFYSMFKVAICHRLDSEFSDRLKAFPFQKSLFISRKFQIESLPKFYLTNRLDLCQIIFPAEITQKIFKCEIRYLSLRYQIITLHDYNFLATHVEKLTFHNSRVWAKINNQWSDASIFMLIYQTPNIKSVDLHTLAGYPLKYENENFYGFGKEPKVKEFHYSIFWPLKKEILFEFVTVSFSIFKNVGILSIEKSDIFMFVSEFCRFTIMLSFHLLIYTAV